MIRRRVHSCQYVQLRYAQKTEESDLRRAFAALNVDGDNKIDVDDLAAFLNGLNHKLKKVREWNENVLRRLVETKRTLK